jgi:hypothetical protein
MSTLAHVVQNPAWANSLATTAAQIQQYLILDVYYNQLGQYRQHFDILGSLILCYTAIDTATALGQL